MQIQRITTTAILVILIAHCFETVRSQNPIAAVPTAPFFQIIAVPTFSPTTKAPTTNAPIANPPTGTPVVAPVTMPPTEFPTVSPSKSPTDRPTLLPTEKPTSLPTETPTFRPTTRPTNSPTVRPTKSPTVLPSINPSSLPTAIPTISPMPTTSTKAPTKSPMPTISPTETRTQFPTKSPTLAPVTSAPTLIQSETLNVVFRLEEIVSLLDTKSRFDFETVTEDFINDSLARVTGIQVVDLGVAVYNQDRIVRRRKLLAMRIGVNVFLEYRSIEENVEDDPNEWVGAAFNSDEKRENFVRALRRRNSSVFGSLESVRVSVDGETPTEANPVVTEKPPEGGDIDFWIILVASIGGGVCFIALLLVVFVVMSRKSSNQKPSAKKTSTQNGPSQNNKPTSDNHLQFAAEIRCEHRADDISTLGDPVGLMQYGIAPRDERTASVGADYDYAKHAGEIGRQNSAEGVRSLTSGMSSAFGHIKSLLGDDDRSFEQQFEILDAEQRFEFQVPPGKLGMVIDTPDGSPPLVHAIKTGSVLDGKVQVGDLLISVDHQNVTDWSAIQVSKLISARSDQQRTLVFGRHNRRRTGSSVFLEDGSV